MPEHRGDARDQPGDRVDEQYAAINRGGGTPLPLSRTRVAAASGLLPVLKNVCRADVAGADLADIAVARRAASAPGRRGSSPADSRRRPARRGDLRAREGDRVGHRLRCRRPRAVRKRVRPSTTSSRTFPCTGRLSKGVFFERLRKICRASYLPGFVRVEDQQGRRPHRAGSRPASRRSRSAGLQVTVASALQQLDM